MEGQNPERKEALNLQDIMEKGVVVDYGPSLPPAKEYNIVVYENKVYQIELGAEKKPISGGEITDPQKRELYLDEAEHPGTHF